MFALTVVDHVRIDSEHLERNYTVHAAAAERIARIVFHCRIVILAIVAAATIAAVASLLAGGRVAHVATVVATSLALLAVAIYGALGLEARLFAHRAFARRLWLLSERYRSLLAEISDGIVDTTTLLRRRDELIREVHAAYEFGFGPDQAGHETARLVPLADRPAA